METKILNRTTCNTHLGRTSVPSININKSGKLCFNSPAAEKLDADYVQLIFSDNKLYICKALENTGFKLRADKSNRSYKVFHSRGLVKSLNEILKVGDKKTIATASLSVSTKIQKVDIAGVQLSVLEIDIEDPIRLKTEFDPDA